MDLIVISGFLGSGKTTLVISTIGKIIEDTKKKVVIIVNDFGTVGIDAKVIAKYGLEVRELASGCICCTMGTDMLQTIEEIEASFAPDLIVIEPTGVADPDAIISTIRAYYKKPFRSMRSIIVVDISRFDLLLKALRRPLEAQLRSASLVLVNKIDLVNASALEKAEKEIRSIAPDVPIVFTSITNGTNIDRVVQEMMKE